MRSISNWENGTQQYYELDELPDKCPHCHCFIEPSFMALINISNEWCEFVFKCPRSECEKLYISYYDRVSRGDYGEYVYYYYQFSKPIHYEGRKFEVEIENLSNSFSKIYNQASQAENDGLDQICGMGYRKALEYLIKDYLIYLNPSDEAKIKQKPLGKCIELDISNTKIKAVAKRAVWIGNDETHYEKKWTDKDIGDLKTLIDITVHWIVMELLTEKYENEMQ